MSPSSHPPTSMSQTHPPPTHLAIPDLGRLGDGLVNAIDQFVSDEYFRRRHLVINMDINKTIIMTDKAMVALFGMDSPH